MTPQEEKFFQTLSEKRQNHVTVFKDDEYSGLWERLSAMGADRAHFVYELLQNADDAGATYAKFILSDNELIFKHNGTRKFTITDPAVKNGTFGDINSITGIGNSNKENLVKKIGKFGIGFKSVFSYTSTPEIFDGNVSFRIEDFIVPILLNYDHTQREYNETLFKFPFNNSNCSPEKAFREIAAKLPVLDCPTLFLTNLQEVTFDIKGAYGIPKREGLYKKEVTEKKKFKDITAELVTLRQTFLKGENLWLFSRKHNGLNYSVGYFLDDKNCLRPVKNKKSAYCFFPTQNDTGLNFIIHAPFLLTSSREGISVNEPHNLTMIDLLAELAADALICLRDIGKAQGLRLIDDNILKIIPVDESAFNVEQGKISFMPFFTKIKEKMRTEKILPTATGYVERENAYWADVIRLTEIFSDKQLRQIANNPNADWVFTKTFRKSNDVNPDYVDEITRNYLDDNAILGGRNDFNSQKIGKTVQGIDGNFIKKQPFDWLHKFYQWIAENSRRINIAKVKPFFLDDQGNVTAAFDNTGKAILFLPTKGLSGYPTVHPKLLANPETAKFLESNIGIKEPDLKDEIYTKILPKYDAKQVNSQSESTYLRKIFLYYKRCPLEKMEKYISDLKAVIYFRTLNSKYCLPKILYFPEDELIEYFDAAGIDAHFLDIDFYLKALFGLTNKKMVYEFFKLSGVADEVRCKEKSGDNAFYLIHQRELPQPKNTSPKKITTWIERYIEGALEIIVLIVKQKDAQKSFLLWKRLVAINQKVGKLKDTLGVYKYTFRNKDMEEKFTPVYVKQMIEKFAWIVDKKGIFRKPKDITIDEMAKDYDTKSDSAREVLEFFGITNLAPAAKRLTATEQKLIAIAQKLEEAGITEDEINKIIADKNKSKSQPQNQNQPSQQKLSAKKIENRDREKISDENISSDTAAQNISEETEIDADDFMPAAVDYKGRLSRAQAKLKSEEDEIKQLEELQEKVSACAKYSFGWFKTLLEMEILNSQKNNANSKEISISFARVEFEAGTQRTLILKYPNRYIPQFMEELENIPLVLHTATKEMSVEIEVAAVRNNTLKVKLKDNSKLGNIKLADVTEATITANNPIFLLEELKNQFNALNLDDNFDMQKNLCENISFVFGPPGTGKTHTLAEKIIGLMSKSNKIKILVLTPTNKAADVIANKIIELDKNKNYREWLLRFGTTSDENIEQSSVFHDKTFDIDSASKNVTVTTIARFPYDFFIPQDKPKIFLSHILWDYIIIDEASMIPLVQILLPLYKRKPKEFIIGGDPFQIEPITAVSLWQKENIYTLVDLKSFTSPQTIKNYSVETLKKQYRSIPAIGKIFSKFTYGGILDHNRKDYDQRPLNIDDWLEVKTLNIIKFPVSKYESIYRSRRLNGSSSYQIYSAIFTFEFVKEMSRRIEKNNPNKKFSVGIIAPYRAQADLIEKLFSTENHSDFVNIQVGTIHTFQGDECDILFAVFNTPPTISSSPEMFLNKQNIINVAISRAKDYLFIIMPDDNTDKIENLRLVKGVENLFAAEKNSGEFSAQDIENLIFGRKNYIEDNSFSTGHQNVNVYSLPERKYEIRSEDTAVDVQIHDAEN